MKKFLKICAVIPLLVSCLPSSQNKNLIYQNIIILSDMSSRIDNKPSKDINEIHKLVQFFKSECVKPGEKIGDKSCISFFSFSGKIATSIDIEKIENLGEKQSFINSTGKFKNSGLVHKIDEFEKNVKNIYANTRDQGLDLISVLIEKLENESIVKVDKYLTNGVDTTFLQYENQIYLFTDGYLEYINKNLNDQFYFGSPEIEMVRQFCKTNRVDIAKALEMKHSLGLPPYRSIKHQYVNLHVLETHERDKNNKFQTYKYPKGQRDNEILEAVWRKWAIESGFKSFEWKKY
jgi:hypothetical protein